MIKAIQDFTQGDSFKVKLRHNPIINIIGATFTLTLNKSENEDSVLSVTTTAEAGDDSTNGIVYINITEEDTLEVPPGQYYISIKRVLDNKTTTIIRTNKHNVGKVTCYKNLVDN
jgi:hypothetical protein